MSKFDTAAKRATFAERLARPGLIVAPGVFEMISARIADTMGFDALYMTGYGTVASHLGLPDAGLATYTDMVGRARTFAEGTATPLIADADTGYGGLLNMDHTMRGYDTAGVVGIQIEDQEFPKKCGHTPGRRVIPLEDMVAKIRVAVDARSSPDLKVIARTDARTAHGLDEALRRADAFAEAGADILFVESPESVEEMRRICRNFDLPLVANMVEGGRTPVLPAAELAKLGYKLAIYPASGFLAMGGALRTTYSALRDDGSAQRVADRMYPFEDFSKLMGFERVWAFDQTHTSSRDQSN